MFSNHYYFKESWNVPNAKPHEVWQIVADPLLAPLWWKGVYLSTEAIGEYPGEPQVGLQVRAVARGFLPYKLRFIAQITDMVPGKSVEVKTQGDFEGTWRAIALEGNGGTRVDIEWIVTVRKPLIKIFSPLLKPLFAWNHSYTTPIGEKGLISYLERQRQIGFQSSPMRNHTI